MNLTKSEYAQFNLQSKVALLKRKGTFLKKIELDTQFDLQLFNIYNFFVEVLEDRSKQEVVAADPVLNKNRLELFIDDIEINSLLY